jgi:hypothetical protein
MYLKRKSVTSDRKESDCDSDSEDTELKLNLDNSTSIGDHTNNSDDDDPFDHIDLAALNTPEDHVPDEIYNMRDIFSKHFSDIVHHIIPNGNIITIYFRKTKPDSDAFILLWEKFYKHALDEYNIADASSQFSKYQYQYQEGLDDAEVKERTFTIWDTSTHHNNKNK